eukprot:TRINITY_DN14477_c0_g1_i1.p1 TRINITY_DN14477_c0_g1~~TRINITY_DN14477_c0_g1_i1.p1  ORF type:complete len:247 (-),score=37.97 TRINITY_DN14477_c0_g1_i1:49-738(-)
MAQEAKSTYVPLHPEIFTYDEEFVQRFISPKLHNLTSIEKVKAAVEEVAEQLYHFVLYTEEYCQFLIEECEHAQKWETNLEYTTEPHPFIEGAVDVCEPDTTVELEDIDPRLVDVYSSVIKNHVQPLVEGLWRTYKLQKFDPPAVRRYTPDLVKGMSLHFDLEVVSMVGYINKDFVGGGTYFPRWDKTVGSHENVVVGSAVIYPGGVSHEHSAHNITSGRRYCLSNSFY